MRVILSLIVLLAVASCAQHGPAPMSPASLIFKSSERLVFAVDSATSEEEALDWARNDLPSYVRVNCDRDNLYCTNVVTTLSRRAVPYERAATEPSNTITLFYQREEIRDCPSYAFGCSVSSNAVKMGY